MPTHVALIGSIGSPSNRSYSIKSTSVGHVQKREIGMGQGRVACKYSRSRFVRKQHRQRLIRQVDHVAAQTRESAVSAPVEKNRHPGWCS